MVRKLLIVFASGMVLAVLAFSAAWLVGGKTLHDQIASGDGFEWTIDDDGHEEHGPRKRINLPLDPGKTVAIAVPVSLEFARGDQARLEIAGPAAAVERLAWKDGRLSLRGGGKLDRTLHVTLYAPQVPALALDAPADVTLAGLDQEDLRIDADGAVSLDASGKVRRMVVNARGAGSFDLADVEGDDATVRVDGAGSVDIAPRHLADVEIRGVGSVSLHRKPQVLRSNVYGIGSIDHDY
ncbi:GIN domain-containing protein [Novosphingobium colocasiae]|uniref:Putative auto-transporter adhesin head GIN domain-containing protein n=1 Tax=Novosphingobium colocasiae TaxID=1256513 RepID=A0A918UGI0_9SPHN|nr:DUF2807 domain-containing protein [Novosphingobium colocasiae]GGZ05278.1 hypothetical protein GCM10011614_20250 [Novosphingobium colocasiae]